MSSSASSAKSLGSVELPKDKYKHTAVQQSAIKQKFLGGVVRDLSKTGNPASLEYAEAEVLEKRRDELQKELEKQLKMESQAKKSSKEMLKKHKKRPSTSSDSSSSSDSGSSSGRKNSSSDDSSTSSSSTSRESRKKMLKKNIKRRRPSSSSSDDHPPIKKKLTSRKHGSHKKSVVKIHVKKASVKASRAITPTSMSRKRSVSPLKVGQKVLPKQKSISKEKHHLTLVKDRSRDTKDRELLRDKEKVRHKEKGVRSRTPVKARVKSRSPRRSPQRSRELKRKSHEKRLSPSKVRPAIRRDRSVDRGIKGSLKEIPRRHESSAMVKERERRDKERADREAARNKERAEALARCQERQRERERLAKEKELAERDKTDRGKIADRLLPRPAERAMALAASRGESHDKMERPRSHSQSNVRRYHESPLRRDREERHGERNREHEYVIVRNRSDTRSSLTYDSSRRSTREDHEVYGEVPIEPRYEAHDDRHLSHDYTRNQYGNERIHREHEWEQGRDRMYDRQDLNRAPVQNEWERSDLGMSSTMARSNDPYVETGEWNVAERQWDETGGGKPAGGWQGGMKEETWEGGYQERDTWMERHREVPDARRWPARRPGHQMMTSGDGDNRPEPYRRPGMPHAHTHIQGDHMNPMGGNASGAYHHNQGMRHIPPALSGSSDMNVSMGSKDYGSQTAATSHFSVNTGMPQTPQKRPRIGEDATMSGLSDANTPSQDLARKAVKSSTSEEVIEDNLSEISDDADEILNSVENVNEQKDIDTDCVEDKKLSDGLKNCQEVPEESKEEVGEKSIKDIHDDFNLGFEEISDGELEEEARVKGLGDALGVDWTSLVTESRARDEANRSEPTSVRQKWKHHQVLLNLGISVKMAGEEFTRDLLKRARQAAEDERVGGVRETDEEAKVGENEANSDIISHVADVQVAKKRATERRARLISQASGCFSRALSARRDLQIRRQLCGFPIQEVHYCSVSPELNNLAVQLFKKATSLTM